MEFKITRLKAFAEYRDECLWCVVIKAVVCGELVLLAQYSHFDLSEVSLSRSLVFRKGLSFVIVSKRTIEKSIWLGMYSCKE